MNTIRGFIFDFNRTLYDPEKNELIAGVLEILKKLFDSGYKLCLLSKKANLDRRRQISQLGLDKYFIDILVTDGDKNESDFQVCVDLMSLRPEQIAVVGDRVNREIKIGNRLGMKTFWFKVGKFSNELPENKDNEPDYTIFKLDEIADFI